MRLPAPVQGRPILADAVLEVLRQKVASVLMRVRSVTDHTRMLVGALAEEHPPCVHLVQMADTFLPVPKSVHTTLAHWQLVPACIIGTVKMSSVRISCGLI
jgi:hypothetical protein